MKLLDEYFELQKRIYDHFGYKEDWRVIPLLDGTMFSWILSQDEAGRGTLFYADIPFTVELIQSGEWYSCTIYTQRFLPKWVYRADDCTMVSIDTRTDGNKFLIILDNEKELKDPPAEIIRALEAWGDL